MSFLGVDGKSNIVTRLPEQTQTQDLPRSHYAVCLEMVFNDQSALINF